MNHALQKTIDCSGFPMNSDGAMGEVLYLSEQLFNMDMQQNGQLSKWLL